MKATFLPKAQAGKHPVHALAFSQDYPKDFSKP
jgi:hypothetical protein